MQELEPLGIGQDVHPADTRDVAAGLVHAGGQSLLDRVAAALKHDRGGRGRCFRRAARRRGAERGNDSDAAANEIGRQCRQAIIFTIRPSILHCYVATFDVTGFRKTAPERLNLIRKSTGRNRGEKPYYRHCPSLRARRKRPHDRRAAEKSNELAPPHIRTQAQGPVLYRLKRVL
jgi:hypothetical protein